MRRSLPNGITKNHILEAIKLISSGRETNFADSTKFDLYYNENRYPPKAVLGLAAELHTGEAYYPSDFSGGVTSNCFRILRSLGFQIVPKLNLSLKKDFLSFSESWVPYIEVCKKAPNTYTVNKSHRAFSLIRESIVKKLYNVVDERLYKIDSSVGDGNLAGIPWIVIMDRKVTTTTREGHYIGLYFSKNAKYVHLSIALGATQFEEIYGKSSKAIKKINEAKEIWSEWFKKYAPKVYSGKFDTMDLMDAADTDFIREFSNTMLWRADSFKAGSFFTKRYSLDEDNLSDELLLRDLEAYLNSYRDIINDPRSSSLIGSLDEIVHTEKDEVKILDYDYDPPIYNPNSYEPKRRSASNKGFGGSSTYSKPSKLVGEKGETYVYEFEKNKLVKAGRLDLAQKIVMQCQDLSSYPGYDILSYTIDGDEMFIEVKSTKTKKKGFFEISSNEVEAAKKYGDSYYIYHVTNTLNEPKIANIFQNPMQLSEQDKASMRPFMYKFKFIS